MDKVSIIVPVFNAEIFIRSCVDSIVQQTYKDIEIILVDDGSTDNSGSICEQMSLIDSRIKVLHKINGGVSSARNEGIKISNGKWIMFVDADDSLDKDAIRVSSEHFNNSDVIRFEAIDSFNKPLIIKAKDRSAYIKSVIERKSYLAIWGGIYKKDIFVNSKIYFDTNLKYGEDWNVLLQLLLNSSVITVINQQLYLYNNQNETSFLNTMNFSKLKNLLVAYSSIMATCYNEEFANSFKKTQGELMYTTISTCLQKDKELLEFNEHANQLLTIGGNFGLLDSIKFMPLKQIIALNAYRFKITRIIVFLLYKIVR